MDKWQVSLNTQRLQKNTKSSCIQLSYTNYRKDDVSSTLPNAVHYVYFAIWIFLISPLRPYGLTLVRFVDVFPSDEGSPLEMLDFDFYIGSTPTFLYFDLLFTVYIFRVSELDKEGLVN